MVGSFLNRIATAVPPYDVHQRFVEFAPTMLKEQRYRALFGRVVRRSQIDHRYSFIQPHSDGSRLDADRVYVEGQFASTEQRMQLYQAKAFSLVKEACDKLDLGRIRSEITHVIVTSCTGFYAPGLDLEIVEHYGLKVGTERTMIGFMGCYAAFNALKLARHIVRSETAARVLVVNVELCTLHLQETDNLEELLSFLIFADGCAASLISSRPQGIELERFYSTIVPKTNDQITWKLGHSGFDMTLSGEVPATILHAVPECMDELLQGQSPDEFLYWAVHPGGRSILDAVQKGFGLKDAQMVASRSVLRDFGNMSSATIMFVIERLMREKPKAGKGCAIAFGPGVTLESLRFRMMAEQ